MPKVNVNLVKPKTTLITAASTHENEEKLVLNAYKRAKVVDYCSKASERFDKVNLLICGFIKIKIYLIKDIR